MLSLGWMEMDTETIKGNNSSVAINECIRKLSSRMQDPQQMVNKCFFPFSHIFLIFFLSKVLDKKMVTKWLRNGYEMVLAMVTKRNHCQKFCFSNHKILRMTRSRSSHLKGRIFDYMSLTHGLSCSNKTSSASDVGAWVAMMWGELEEHIFTIIHLIFELAHLQEFLRNS